MRAVERFPGRGMIRRRRRRRAAARRAARGADGRLQREREATVAASSVRRGTHDEALGTHDPQRVAAHVAATHARLEDQPVARAMGFSGREEVVARGVARSRPTGVGVLVAHARLPDQIPDPEQHEDREQRPHDPDDEQYGQPADGVAPVRGDEHGRDLQDLVPDRLELVLHGPDGTAMRVRGGVNASRTATGPPRGASRVAHLRRRATAGPPSPRRCVAVATRRVRRIPRRRHRLRGSPVAGRRRAQDGAVEPAEEPGGADRSRASTPEDPPERVVIGDDERPNRARRVLHPGRLDVLEDRRVRGPPARVADGHALRHPPDTTALVDRAIEHERIRTVPGITPRNRPTMAAGGPPPPRTSWCRRFDPSTTRRSMPSSGSRREAGIGQTVASAAHALAGRPRRRRLSRLRARARRGRGPDPPRRGGR